MARDYFLASLLPGEVITPVDRMSDGGFSDVGDVTAGPRAIQWMEENGADALRTILEKHRNGEMLFR